MVETIIAPRLEVDADIGSVLSAHALTRWSRPSMRTACRPSSSRETMGPYCGRATSSEIGRGDRRAQFAVPRVDQDVQPFGSPVGHALAAQIIKDQQVRSDVAPEWVLVFRVGDPRAELVQQARHVSKQSVPPRAATEWPVGWVRQPRLALG